MVLLQITTAAESRTTTRTIKCLGFKCVTFFLEPPPEAMEQDIRSHTQQDIFQHIHTTKQNPTINEELKLRLCVEKTFQRNELIPDCYIQHFRRTRGNFLYFFKQAIVSKRKGRKKRDFHLTAHVAIDARY